MIIDFNKFLDIFYTILNNEGNNEIDFRDIIETVKILISSDEFRIVSKRLNINNIDEEKLKKHRYTKDIDENQIVSFEVPIEDRVKIIEENKIDAGYIQKAISKRVLCEYLKSETNGLVELIYDNTDGTYNMPKVEKEGYEEDSEIYTDGEISKNKIFENPLTGSTIRNIKIENSTFTMFLYYVNDYLEKMEVRGSFKGDYYLLLNEIKRVVLGNDDSFEETISESPRVYKFRVH